MPGIWSNNSLTPEGKFPIVLRRDGKPVETPYFVLLEKDPCFEAAIIAYADKAEELGLDPQFISDLRSKVQEAAEVKREYGIGNPDAAPHRKDDQLVLAWARSIGSPSW